MEIWESRSKFIEDQVRSAQLFDREHLKTYIRENQDLSISFLRVCGVVKRLRGK
jgi:hypothetical protein